MNTSTTTSILTLASEIYAANCKQDPEFNTLSADSIAACVRVDLQDKLNRELTDAEEDMVDEALLLFGVGAEQPKQTLTEAQALALDVVKTAEKNGDTAKIFTSNTGIRTQTLKALARKGLVSITPKYRHYEVKSL